MGQTENMDKNDRRQFDEMDKKMDRVENTLAEILKNVNEMKNSHVELKTKFSMYMDSSDRDQKDIKNRINKNEQSIKETRTILSETEKKFEKKLEKATEKQELKDKETQAAQLVRDKTAQAKQEKIQKTQWMILGGLILAGAVSGIVYKMMT